MILTCSNCLAKFIVKAEDIGESGRRVRCSICRHTWFQMQPQELPEILESIAHIYPSISEVEPIPEGSNLPVEFSYETPLYLRTAFLCLVVIFVFTLSIVNIDRMRPYLGAYYNIIGIKDDDGIVLYNVSAEKNNGDDGAGLLVKGRIVNESKSDKMIPDVRITLLDQGHKNLRVITLASSAPALMPGEGVNFENQIKPLPKNVETIVMDIGNSVNLAAR